VDASPRPRRARCIARARHPPTSISPHRPRLELGDGSTRHRARARVRSRRRRRGVTRRSRNCVVLVRRRARGGETNATSPRVNARRARRRAVRWRGTDDIDPSTRDRTRRCRPPFHRTLSKCGARYRARGASRFASRSSRWPRSRSRSLAVEGSVIAVGLPQSHRSRCLRKSHGFAPLREQTSFKRTVSRRRPSCPSCPGFRRENFSTAKTCRRRNRHFHLCDACAYHRVSLVVDVTHACVDSA
jgi:hypothetical protein